MSIRIYQDENSVAAFGRKSKREETKLNKHNVPKPNKRVALSNITNHGCRVQPTRAAKEKQKVLIFIFMPVFICLNVIFTTIFEMSSNFLVNRDLETIPNRHKIISSMILQNQ